MKGVELLSSLIAILIMIGVGTLFGGIVIFAINLANLPTSRAIDYETYMFAAYPPIKYETMMLSYLETTEPTSGFQIKKILNYAAYQEKIDGIYIEGENITKPELEAATRNVIEQWIPQGAYLLELKVGDETYVITKNAGSLTAYSEDVLRIRKISIPLYIDNRNFVVTNQKNTELPIKITLDFYVV